MIILFDMGNSRCKWALVDKQAAINESDDWQIGSWKNQSHSEQHWLKKLGELKLVIEQKGASLQTIVISSVASDKIKQQVATWCDEVFAIVPLFAESQPEYRSTKGTLTNSYQQAAALGVDRWLVMIAVFEGYTGAVAVFDLGTAITLDVLDESGLHLGGHIVAGAHLMSRSLFGETGRIAWGAALDPESALADQWLGCNSQQAVELGALQASVGYIESSIRRLKRKYKLKQIVVTGGGYQSLATLLVLPGDVKLSEHKNLVLEGLYHWFLTQKQSN